MPPTFDAFRYIDCLPILAWEKIFSFLDGGSLIAFARAVSNLKCIPLQARFVRALKFTTDTDESNLEDFHALSISKHVEKVDFNNCIALKSAALLRFVSSCANLRELCCVKCIVEPTRLFALLATELRQVRSLEWSLHESCLYEPSTQPNFHPPNSQLESMYIELDLAPQQIYRWMKLVRQCCRLRNLHIHCTWGNCDALLVAELCRMLINWRPILYIFKFTCDRDLYHQALRSPIRWEPFLVPVEGIMFGNISCQVKPVSSRSVVLLEDEPLNMQLGGVTQAVVVMEAGARTTHRRLSEATLVPQHYTKVSSLCLVMLAASDGAGLATATQRDIDATRFFFKSCVSHSVTELNIASYHFDSDTDGCSIIGSALPQLRALALTPCGANRGESLGFLARGCKNLEQLDIGAAPDRSGMFKCQCCKVPLKFSEASFKELHETTRLRQLSLDGTARITSLDFLRECRVRELQLSLASVESRMKDTASFHLSLSRLLRANTMLRSLTIEDPKIPLRGNVFAAGIARISTLRHICVLTRALTTEERVASFFRFMEAQLPRLQVLHAHYLNPKWSVVPITWLRQRRPVATRVDNDKQWCSEVGLLLDNSPCIGCWRRTFIGLTKPRNL